MIWEPSREFVEQTNAWRFLRRLGFRERDEFLRFSVDRPERFWDEIMRELDVAWFEPGTGADATADMISIAAEEPFRCLVYAGPPIDEPVVAYGPFVMNTLDDIRQAFADYEANRLVA